MYILDGEVCIEEEDQCYTCVHNIRDGNCPLLEALALAVVTLPQDILVKNCGLYNAFKRHLRVVDENEPEKTKQNVLDNVVWIGSRFEEDEEEDPSH